MEDIINLVAGLRELKTDIINVDGEAEDFCANEVWASTFKPRLTKLVGWESESTDPRLVTAKAYSFAYNKLYELLPPCKQCGCA